MPDEETIQDIELINRCRSGDEQAFGVLYQRYRLPLFSYLHKLIPSNHGLVEDLFQQTWLKAVRSWDKYSDQQRLLAWLCRIAHNLVMDYYRAQQKMQYEELGEHDDVSQSLEGSQVLEQDELMMALDRAIEALPAEQREVLEYRRAGRSFKEIAEEKRLSMNTVLGRMHYAVLKLRASLQEFLTD